MERMLFCIDFLANRYAGSCLNIAPTKPLPISTMARIHTSLDLKRGLQLIPEVIDHSDNLRNAVRSSAITAQNKRSHSLVIRGAQYCLVTI